MRVVSNTVKSEVLPKQVGWKKLKKKIVERISFEEPISFKERISFEVGGTTFSTFRDTLFQFPNTLLGAKERLEKFYDPQRKVYVLNRDAQVFSLILSFYQSGGRSG